MQGYYIWGRGAFTSFIYSKIIHDYGESQLSIICFKTVCQCIPEHVHYTQRFHTSILPSMHNLNVEIDLQMHEDEVQLAKMLLQNALSWCFHSHYIR